MGVIKVSTNRVTQRYETLLLLAPFAILHIISRLNVLPVIYLLIFYFLFALRSQNLQMGSSCIFCDELVVWCSEWYGEVFQCFDAVGWVTGRAFGL